METKEFHIGDVLTVTTGKLLSPRVMEGVYDILRWMTGGPVWTHQIGRVFGEARPILLAAHPQLAAISGEDITSDNAKDWLAARVAEIGETLAVPKMTADQYERIDPISEAAEVFHPDRIAVVAIDPKAGA